MVKEMENGVETGVILVLSREPGIPIIPRWALKSIDMTYIGYLDPLGRFSVWGPGFASACELPTPDYAGGCGTVWQLLHCFCTWPCSRRCLALHPGGSAQSAFDQKETHRY